jgi:hypothetical protein
MISTLLTIGETAFVSLDDPHFDKVRDRSS